MRALAQLPVFPLSALIFLAAIPAQPQSLTPIPAFPLATSSLVPSSLVIARPTQPTQPFTVAGPRGVIAGAQDGSFEAWVLPIKLLSHLTIEAQVEGYSVPISVNQQSASIEVRPDRTTITYAHIAFTLRQIMFSPDTSTAAPSTGPVVLFQIDSPHPVHLTFRFTPEMRWMWPKRNDGVPGADWVARNAQGAGGYYVLHMDYPDLAGAVTIPGAEPGILAPYQERPQVHPLELNLSYDPKRDGTGDRARYFPLLMAVGATKESASNTALGAALETLNASIPASYRAHAASYDQLLAGSTSIETPDKALNAAFSWGVVSIEQLKAHAFPSAETPEATALVAGYYPSGDSARPGFGWFFGRDALYTLYAVNSFGDFALTRDELSFLIARQRDDGKIMHEYSQTATDPAVHWRDFGYMYAAADASPLFLMAMRDYLRASGDLAFLKANRQAIEKAWAFETAPSSDTDHDGIYDNSQGTGWVESWPHDKMPHQEVYLALLDEQASLAFADLETALSEPAQASAARARAAKIQSTIETEYYDPNKGCYAFSHNLSGDPNGETDKSSTVYPAIAWWDANLPTSPLAHPDACLAQWASPAIATDWGLRDVADTEPFYDGMSYHQGSVWPLFTGWGALAEYRANQPLSGQQMLMQNVDLTWAQDPGAVTELLSGDFYVPFGRSTSHQLWSSAMVITPTLRGLFGINLDAATNTITVNPHLPAHWDHSEIHNLHLGNRLLSVEFLRQSGSLTVRLLNSGGTPIQLKSDQPGAKPSRDSTETTPEIQIPLPAVEFDLPDHALPEPGSRPAQVKVISTVYGPNRVTLTVQAPANSDASLLIRRNRLLMPKLDDSWKKQHPGSKIDIVFVDTASHNAETPMRLDLHFPPGPEPSSQAWQTIQLTLTW